MYLTSVKSKGPEFVVCAIVPLKLNVLVVVSVTKFKFCGEVKLK